MRPASPRRGAGLCGMPAPKPADHPLLLTFGHLRNGSFPYVRATGGVAWKPRKVDLCSVHTPPFHVCLKVQQAGRKSTLGLGGLSTQVSLGSYRHSDVMLLTVQGLCSHPASTQAGWLAACLARDQVEPQGVPGTAFPQGTHKPFCWHDKRSR